MPRVTAVDPATATGEVKDLLDGVRAMLGMTPNMALTMAVSHGALEGWIELSRALALTLDRRLAERIAIVTAEENGCGYCLSAHTAGGRALGIDDDELAASRDGASSHPEIAAALRFAQAVNATPAA